MIANMHARSYLSLALVVLTSVALTGCATLQSEDPRETAARKECVRLFQSVDRAVLESGVADAETQRIKDFPYLRVDRFLASYRYQLSAEGFIFWVDLMRELEWRARAREVANLPLSAVAGLAMAVPHRTHLLQRLQSCGYRLREMELKDPKTRQRLRTLAHVPPHYSAFTRVMGAYPFSAWLVLYAVGRLHAETRRTFETPLRALPVKGTIVRYGPSAGPAPSDAEVRDILVASAKNPLRIPLPVAKQRDRLFARFAPVWEVDVSSPADRIGAPYWGLGERPLVNSERWVYRRLSHVRFGGEALLQLNYIIWFPARPVNRPFDLLSGHLDGIIWRVTLAQDGRPIMYDAIHNCGCYHMFFPTVGLRFRAQSGELSEPLWVPQLAPELSGAKRLVVRIESGTHYIQRLYPADDEAIHLTYGFSDYEHLGSLPSRAETGRRSLFTSRGMVSGTERAERWLLWPMGIRSPGAMRQWGHHATAFVGHRHFDDPDLVERYFMPADRWSPH